MIRALINAGAQTAEFAPWRKRVHRPIRRCHCTKYWKLSLSLCMESSRQTYPSSSEPETRLKALRDAIHGLKEKRAALCISGGGIRSATFGLGILQGLARCGLLDKFHYLSTVSGGSYIGAWLSTWIKREGIFPARYDLARSEPQAVRNVRNHSTYLTEKSGSFGGAWTWFVAYLWQLMAFWLTLGLSAAAVLLLSRLWFALLSWHPTNAGNYSALICAACAAVAILYVISDLPGLGNQKWSQGRFVTFFLIPLSAGLPAHRGIRSRRLTWDGGWHFRSRSRTRRCRWPQKIQAGPVSCCLTPD